MEKKEHVPKYLVKGRIKEIQKNKEKNGEIKKTQKELSLLSGVPQPFISRFDNSINQNYNINNLIALSEALGVTIEELFEWKLNPDYKPEVTEEEG